MSKSQNKKGILVVDDAQFIRNRIKKAIEKIEFCEVIGEASNGDDAITLYKELKPDLVTMDLVMPNTDGIKAIEEIMKYDKKAKIVVISAMGQEMSVLEATEKGAKDYIKKPFKEEDIYKTIEKFLKS
ncbi:MAG: response regulator [Promethearchaeota archaeon]